MVKHAAAAAPNLGNRPLLYLNFRPLVMFGLGLLLFFPPFLRGLFFAPELLITHQVAAGIFLLFILDRVIKKEAETFSHPLDWLLLGLFLAYLASLSVAVNLRGAAGEALKYLNYFLVYLMVSRSVRSLRAINYLLHIIFAGAVGVAAVGLLSATGHLNYPGAWSGAFINSTLQYRNALAGYLVAAQVVGFTLWLRARNSLHQTLLALGSLLTVTVLLLSQSRGGWIVYALAAAVWLTGLQDRFWRGCYLFFLNLGVAMLATRAFLPEVLAQDATGAIRVLFVAGGVVAAAQLLIALGDRLLARQSLGQPYRALLTYGGLLYIAAVVGVYAVYAARALPRIGAQFLPVALLNRAGSINPGDESVVGRLVFFRDALEIVKNHPVLGAGGGAWSVLYHRYKESMYYTTEVHSAFLQTWVETGTIGFFLFTGFWALLGIVLFRLWLNRDRAGPNYLPVWSSGVAVLALVGHSAFDFNLSLPALAILAWALAGIVRGSLAGTDRHVIPGKTPAGRENPAGLKQPWLQLIWGLVLVLALGVPSWRFYQAGVVGAEGARAINSQHLFQARELMTKAHRLNPLSATYLADLAQLEAVLGLADNDDVARHRAGEYARRAVRLEPFNPQVRATVSFAYLLLGQPDQAVAEAHALLTINPLDISAYEYYGRTAIAVAMHYVSRREYPLAKPYLEQVVRLPSLVEVKSQEVAAVQRDWIGRRKMLVTPLIHLSAGQAACLLGDYALAKQLLKAAAEQQELSAEASLWLAVAATRSNNRAEAEKHLALARAEDQGADQLFKEIVETLAFER